MDKGETEGLGGIMPTITFEKEDLERLVGRSLRLDDLEEYLLAAKIEVEDVRVEEGRTILEVEVGDTNRPDLWSVEGIARFLRGLLGKDVGVWYKVEKPVSKVFVEKTVLPVRPYIACAIVRGVELGREGFEQLIQLQDKLMLTYGRRRRKVAIGTSNADLIRFPVHYRGVDPHSATFVPLYENIEMDLAEILEKTEKGREYRFILEGHDVYPILMDDRGRVISFPPIINSEDIGHIDEKTRNIFIDVTGTDWKAVNIALNVVTTALAERGGSIQALEIVRPDGTAITPDLTPRSITVDARRLVQLAGISLGTKDVAKTLRKVGYEPKRIRGDKIELLYPAYRGDVMHERDVLEDLLVALDYNKIEPEIPIFFTKGGLQRITWLEDALRELFIGFGAQEVLNFILTSPEVLSKSKQPGSYVELENPVTLTYSVVRNAIFPVLMDFLAANTSAPYPQKVFEIGEVVVADETSPTGVRTEVHAGYATAHSEATYTDVRQTVETILHQLGVDFIIRGNEMPFYIPGRSAEFLVQSKPVAHAGEVHPAVLEAFGIEMPVAYAEINVSMLLEVLK